MEGSFALTLYLALVLTAAAATERHRIVFPVSVTLEEGDACTLHSGAPGRCADIRECDYTDVNYRHNPPVRCGFKGIFPVVCCPNVSGIALQPVTDIAPPKGTDHCYSITLHGFGVGSEPAPRNAWPWMALIGERDAESIRWFCGGALINEQWVLSALHCIIHNTAEVVRLGEHNYKDDNDGALHQDFNVAEMVVYPGYTHPEAYHDLVLFRLSSTVHIQEIISPVCLPWGSESEDDITGHKATLTGYGDTEFGGTPTTYLQQINMTIFTSDRCDRNYSTLPEYTTNWPQGIGKETLCAGDPNGGRDACQGDSGGPLVTKNIRERFVLAGIVSQGYGCGLKDYPGLYANMRHPPYLAWIKKVAFTAL